MLGALDLGTQERRIRHPQLDAHRIAQRLWLGAYPQAAEGNRLLADSGITMLVLCAKEFQTAPTRFPGTDVVRLPLNDDPFRPVSPAEWLMVQRAAWRIAAHHKAGGRVLVTCRKGVNRSALVLTKALTLLCPQQGVGELIDLVRARRHVAGFVVLGNPRFVEALLSRP